MRLATLSAAAFGKIITRSIYPYCAYLLMYFVCIHTYSLLAHDRFHVIWYPDLYKNIEYSFNSFTYQKPKLRIIIKN